MQRQKKFSALYHAFFLWMRREKLIGRFLKKYVEKHQKFPSACSVYYITSIRKNDELWYLNSLSNFISQYQLFMFLNWMADNKKLLYKLTKKDIRRERRKSLKEKKEEAENGQPFYVKAAKNNKRRWN